MTIEQIKEKIEVGDYGLAAKMLNISTDNVRVRFQREKEDVLKALINIIQNRDQLIKDFQLEELNQMIKKREQLINNSFNQD